LKAVLFFFGFFSFRFLSLVLFPPIFRSFAGTFAAKVYSARVIGGYTLSPPLLRAYPSHVFRRVSLPPFFSLRAARPWLSPLPRLAKRFGRASKRGDLPLLPPFLRKSSDPRPADWGSAGVELPFLFSLLFCGSFPARRARLHCLVSFFLRETHLVFVRGSGVSGTPSFFPDLSRWQDGPPRRYDLITRLTLTFSPRNADLLFSPPASRASFGGPLLRMLLFLRRPSLAAGFRISAVRRDFLGCGCLAVDREEGARSFFFPSATASAPRFAVFADREQFFPLPRVVFPGAGGREPFFFFSDYSTTGLFSCNAAVTPQCRTLCRAMLALLSLLE